VPLSEHEQRLLEQMERALYAEDPKFASALRGADLRTHFRRRAYQAMAGFVLGVALLMTGLVAKFIPVSIIGFLVMLTCAVLAVSSWRRIPGPGEITTMTGPTPRRHRQRMKLMDRLEERWRRRRDEGDQS
jgi:Protein of unknown function (DUF3040)